MVVGTGVVHFEQLASVAPYFQQTSDPSKLVFKGWELKAGAEALKRALRNY